VDLVLKGAGTTIFSRDKRIFINPTGNPALAKGGTGDILTGLIGGLVAQGYSLTEAAMFGVYLHGYSADTWVERHTSMDMVAGDILSGLSGALRDIGDGTDRVYINRSL
jgi:NAD(P)H-hydrate epimerase